MHPDYKFENTIANGEFMLATGVIGASNAVRERAWDPGVMWGWADPLVEQATRPSTPGSSPSSAWSRWPSSASTCCGARVRRR